MKIRFESADDKVRMWIDRVYPGPAIRSPCVTEELSTVTAILEVRQVLVLNHYYAENSAA